MMLMTDELQCCGAQGQQAKAHVQESAPCVLHESAACVCMHMHGVLTQQQLWALLSAMLEGLLEEVQAWSQTFSLLLFHRAQ